jgi:quercetin dioxygenase-like cupin family protein
MQITRFIATAKGTSQFVKMNIPLPVPYTDEFGNVYSLSEGMSYTGVIAELPAGLDQDWHVAPSRQFVIVMSGAIDVETGDGAVQRFSQGDLFMADDRTGPGHRTRVIGGRALLMFLKLADDFDAERWTTG